MSLWMKCGKLLTNGGGTLINCRTCPCGYYAVFGIKYRPIDQNTLQPTNTCSWSYMVIPAEVIDGRIYWTEYGPTVCIEVNKNLGRCGYRKVVTDCWQDCAQWDYDTWECLQTETYCYFCYEIEVYMISYCYDSYDDFAEAFYTPCNVSPSNGSYPAIWETYYGGQKYITSTAYNCVQTYWNKAFCDKYMLNFTLRYQILGQCWWQNAGITEYQMATEYYDYCYNDSTGSWCQNATYDSDYRIISCNDPGCTIHTEQWQYQQYPLSVGCQVYMLQASSGIQFRYYNAGGGYWDGSQYHETCSDRAAAYAAMGPCNQHINSIASVKSNYVIYSDSYYGSKGTGTWTTTCNNSNNLCINWSYSSGPFQNYYGSITNATIMYRWSQFKLERTSNTPSTATGVKFEMTLIHTLQNDGQGNVSSSTSSSVTNVTLNFGDSYNTSLPLALDITLWTLIKNIVCDARNEWCVEENDGCKIYAQPITNDYGGQYGGRWDQNVKRDTYSISLKAIEYV